MRTALSVLFAASFAGAAPSTSPNDKWVTAKTKLALLTADELSLSTVHVDTADGHVTISGKVHSLAEKAIVETIARGVKGVRDVRDLLQIVPLGDEKPVRINDELVAKGVSTALKADPSLSTIRVKSVAKGVVLLSGTTDNMGDYLLAVERAHAVSGVGHVFSEIKGPEGTLDWKERRGKTHSDSYLTAATKLRLVGDSRVQAVDVHVDTDHGVVTLFGAVPSLAERSAAESDAHRVAGVTQVWNELEVDPTSKRKLFAADDQLIRSTVEAALQVHSIDQVNVTVENGAVHLTGTVATIWKQLNADIVARAVAGVRSLQDDLQVTE